MARIRNIKPDYFRHEQLQDLEVAYPGCYVMLTYIALWTQCDANGIFPYKPRTLKLDILPFIEFDIANTLQILHTNGFIETFENQGNTYGIVPTFKTHQRITGKEATEGRRYPTQGHSTSSPLQSGEGQGVGLLPGNTRETSGKHPDAQGEERRTGKENREREGDNARAHEEKFENQKIPPDQPLPDRLRAAIMQWAENDPGNASLRDWKRQAGYSDSKHGPTTAELVKFIGHYLGKPERQAITSDPVNFFIERFPQWLVRATEYNRPKKDNRPKYEPPPYTQNRQNGNATPVIAIGDLAGKTLTKIGTDA